MKKRLAVVYHENGILLTLQYITRWLQRKIFNFFLAKKLGVNKVSIGIYPHIRGLSNMKIGKNFTTGCNLRLEAITNHRSENYNPLILIKDNVNINDFVHIGAINYIEIGNNVLMASKIYISDHNHGIYVGENQSNPFTPPDERVLSKDSFVVIEDNVWIGEFVSILPNVRIGFGSIIGANSVVTKDVPAFSIAVGSPARVIKKFDSKLGCWVNSE